MHGISDLGVGGNRVTLLPKTSIVPPGGFHFVDETGAVPVRIEGYDAEDVAVKTLKHRLAAALPAGNPLEEYRSWLCSTWPHFCTDTSPPERGSTIVSGEHISKRTATWMGQFFRGGFTSKFVSDGEAARRAAICATCPKNIRYNETGCGACLESIERLSFVYRANRATPSDLLLYACNETGQHNGCAVWAVTLPALPEAAQLPTHCWRKAALP